MDSVTFAAPIFFHVTRYLFSEVIARDKSAGWVEPKAIPIGRSERGRWVSLRSTHPTLASRGDPPDNRPVGAAMAAMAFREEHRGHCRSPQSTFGSGLVPDRSAERGVGKEGVGTGGSRWARYQ